MKMPQSRFLRFLETLGSNLVMAKAREKMPNNLSSELRGSVLSTFRYVRLLWAVSKGIAYLCKKVSMSGFDRHLNFESSFDNRSSS